MSGRFIYNDKVYECPMELALNLVEDKYKLNILCHLSEQTSLRFGELKRLFNSISHKVLTSQLRELERDQLINRTVFPSVPPKVEYSLTVHGQKLMPVFAELNKWGQYYMDNVKNDLKMDIELIDSNPPLDVISA